MKKISRKILLKRQKRKEKKELKESLKIWRNSVLKRDEYKCQMCNKQFGNSSLQAHHIIPRFCKQLLTNINNGLTLCFHCHKVGYFSPHMNALFFTNWLNENKYSQYEYLMQFIKGRIFTYNDL